MKKILPILTIISVIVLFVYRKKIISRRQNNETPTISESDKFTSLQFSLDHAERTLNNGHTLHPFAMTMFNRCADTNYYNFENEPISIESILTLLKANNEDIDLIWLLSNDEVNSKLEIQSFMKGIKKSAIMNMNYRIIDDRYEIDRLDVKITKAQPNFLYKQ